MYRPAFFDDNFFNDFLGFPAERPHQRKEYDSIRTDVMESPEGYRLEMELPGYTKEEINIKLEDGYLTVTASKRSEVSEDGPHMKYVRRERRSGSCARCFFVGKTLAQEDMKARFENGILTLSFPKEDAKRVESTKYISIE